LRQGGSDIDELTRFARKAIDHPAEEVRTRGYQAFLRNNTDTQLLPKLIEALGRETYTNQKLLSEAIGQLLPHSDLPPSETLFPLMASGTAALRTSAVNVLKRLPQRQAILRSFFVYSRALAPWVRDRAFDTLQELGDELLEPLISMMEDKDKELRLLAISLASMLGEDRRMLQPLLNTLQEDNWWIRSMAAETLARIGDPSAIKPLKKFLRSEDDAWIAIDALANLAKQLNENGDRRSANAALDPLLQLLKTGQGPSTASSEQEEERADLRVEVLTALRIFESPAILDVYRRVASGDRSPKVKAEALAAARSMSEQLGQQLEDEEKLRDAVNRAVVDLSNLTPMEGLMTRARSMGASDLHISVHKPPMVRCNGRLRTIDPSADELSADRSARLIRSLLTEAQASAVAHVGQLDFCHEIPGAGRYRA
ncbi:MAG: HEAT repeat domain-containing protein, partial [Myxococcota bacterium]